MTEQIKLAKNYDTHTMPMYLPLNDQECRHLQHEFKIYIEQYFKDKLGKSVNYTKIVIWDDMLSIRGKGFLTDVEKYIIATQTGKEVVKAARMEVVRMHTIDNTGYFENKLGAKAIHHAYDLEPENDFWMHIMVFDSVLTAK